MNDKIGRNDPCPCGSGKKYKRCCMTKGRSEIGRSHAPLSEEEILAPLLAANKSFQKFYESERPGIGVRIQWERDTSLPPGIDFHVTRSCTGDARIRLRRFPPQPTDAVTVAHELVHLVLDSRGFPAIGGQRFEKISSAINSMVHDPHVFRILLEYGLDPYPAFRQDIDRAKRTLERESQSPTGRFGQLLWSVNCVSQVLESRVLGKSAEALANRFLSWFNARYPDLAPMNDKLLLLVEETGFDTPASMRELLAGIIREYGLEGKVGLAAS